MYSRLEAALRELLKHARASCDGYAFLPDFDETPAGPSFVHAFAQLPLLTRADMQRERTRLRSQTCDKSSWQAARTSGTTGEPAEIVLDAAARTAEADALARHVECCLGSDDWRNQSLLHLTLHVGALSRTMPSPYETGHRTAKWNLIRLWQADDSRFLAGLQHLHGNVVTMTASVGELLARRILHAGADSVRPLLILLSGEDVPDSTPPLLEDVFDCPVSSLYTLAEAGIIGSACPKQGGYHVQEDIVYVEILMDDGSPADPDAIGNVTITPVLNRAMPLIRYQTGDRAAWKVEPCGCGLTSARLVLDSGRRPACLVSASGATVNTVRFAKLFASIGIGKYRLNQSPDGAVSIRYEADRMLSSAAHSLITASMRCSLGPDTPVRISRVASLEDGADATPAPTGSNQHSPAERSEPLGPSALELADWLKPQLAGVPDVDVALLTGSIIDPTTTSRYSDIDLVLLSHAEVSLVTCTALSDSLRASVPDLTLMFDRFEGLQSRAPLFTCRLLTEQVLVIGHLTLDDLSWPIRADIVTEGRFRCQQGRARLLHRMLNPETGRLDPIQESWIAAKHIYEALRVRYLAQGLLSTAIGPIEDCLQSDSAYGPSWKQDFRQIVEISREHRPLIATQFDSRQMLLTALYCLQVVAADLEDAVT